MALSSGSSDLSREQLQVKVTASNGLSRPRSFLMSIVSKFIEHLALYSNCTALFYISSNDALKIAIKKFRRISIRRYELNNHVNQITKVINL
jgi:hypothetical protein